MLHPHSGGLCPTVCLCPSGQTDSHQNTKAARASGLLKRMGLFQKVRGRKQQNDFTAKETTKNMTKCELELSVPYICIMTK